MMNYSQHSGGGFLQITRSGGGRGGGEKDSKKVVMVKAENNKSMLFLLKKFFVCGFSSLPPPVPADPSSQPTLGQLWTSILHNKIYPHWSSREPISSIPNKYIDNGHPLEFDDDDEQIDWPKQEASGSKWDRTDSEYIVLEI